MRLLIRFVLGLGIMASNVTLAEEMEMPSSGTTSPALAPLDDLLRAAIEKQNAVGVALAIAKEGKLIYARGFGYADRETKTPVQPDSLFRIASVSKPMTAIAIMQLVEQKRLSLDGRIFELLELEKKILDATRFDPRWRDVTIQQLLYHGGGWDRNASFDPMFQSVLMAAALGKKPPASAHDVIQFMLSQPLDFDPGERSAYSNFGYNLLGRVIEKVSGETYEQYMQKTLFAPLGITRMKISSSIEQASGEVKYYDENNAIGLAVVGEPLGRRVPVTEGTWYQESLDAHGGWIASAIDLVRVTTALDFDSRPLMSPETKSMMFSPPPGSPGHDEEGKTKETFYSLGWYVRPLGDGKENAWHGGSLPGTSTQLVRRADGYSWAVLFNTRSNKKGQQLAGLHDGAINQAIDRVKEWPVEDQFPHWLKPN